MAEIIPFRALRYDPHRIPDLAQVVTPPYDIISVSYTHLTLPTTPYV